MFYQILNSSEMQRIPLNNNKNVNEAVNVYNECDEVNPPDTVQLFSRHCVNSDSVISLTVNVLNLSIFNIIVKTSLLLL